MTALVTSSSAAIQANLAALGALNGDVCERLRLTSPAGNLAWADTEDRTPSAALDGRWLASRRRPLDEARRFADGVNLIEHAVVVVLGFGLGYHVQRLAERLGKAGLIVVFEPDVPVLRAVLERVDHSAWLKDSMVAFITDEHDRAALAGKLRGAETLLAQGAEFLEHPGSRARLGERSGTFSTTFREFVTGAKTTLMTTLMRSVDTVRNLMLNVDHYVGGDGITPLAGLMAGKPGVVVSAGPSLSRNIDRLAEPGVGDRCCIIAVQTTLKPLLDRGIRPHFVTALDYHAISQRFYEDLTAGDVAGTTLIADPKANPIILDVYPGPIRCCAAGFLDKLLAAHGREMGQLPAGATVAHLAASFAHYVGCNPIVLIGQDLGFTDGLYYAPGNAIHDVWATELNPFNTVEMMEWQRIVRHRTHLEQTTDIHGKPIYTDAQMLTYLHQFERDFADLEKQGVCIIDATEGGVRKQHTTVMSLHEALDQNLADALPEIPLPGRKPDHERMTEAASHLRSMRRRVGVVGDAARDTSDLIGQMIADQRDSARMDAHFEALASHRKTVESHFDAFELINHLNQLGVFKRLKADRRLHLQDELGPLERQRDQLERDLANVEWIGDASVEMIAQIDQATALLRRQPPPTEQLSDDRTASTIEVGAELPMAAAIIPVDPNRPSVDRADAFTDHVGGGTILQHVLERLGQSTTLSQIILLTPRNFDPEFLIDRDAIGLPVVIERCEPSPFPPEHEAIIKARLWSPTCWRGGIAGLGTYDEAFCPCAIYKAMQAHGVDAAMLVGADWPLINVIGPGGCDAIVRRHWEQPDKHRLVFTQSPPGLCGCLVAASLLAELQDRNRLATIGGLLVYQPHAPQHDPIARDANVQIEPAVRRAAQRLTAGSLRDETIERLLELGQDSRQIIEASDEAVVEQAAAPAHLVLELTTRRASRGAFHARLFGGSERAEMEASLARSVIEQFGESPGRLLTLAGAGDPLLYPEFDAIIQHAIDHGVRSVHVRTELRAEADVIRRLMAAPVDVISVDLQADTAATYSRMMGRDDFREVLENIEGVIGLRRRLTDQQGTAAIALPWIVPRLLRCSETYDDLESFFDRWQHVLGTAVIDGAGERPADPGDPFSVDTLRPARTPRSVLQREGLTQLTLRSDGTAPLDERFVGSVAASGDVRSMSLKELWQSVRGQREES